MKSLKKQHGLAMIIEMTDNAANVKKRRKSSGGVKVYFRGRGQISFLKFCIFRNKKSEDLINKTIYRFFMKIEDGLDDMNKPASVASRMLVRINTD